MTTPAKRKQASGSITYKGWRLVPEQMPFFGDRVGVYDPTGRRRANVPNMTDAKAFVRSELRASERRA